MSRIARDMGSNERDEHVAGVWDEDRFFPIWYREGLTHNIPVSPRAPIDVPQVPHNAGQSELFYDTGW